VDKVKSPSLRSQAHQYFEGANAVAPVFRVCVATRECLWVVALATT
jgi:hypothetical protein